MSRSPQPLCTTPSARAIACFCKGLAVAPSHLVAAAPPRDLYADAADIGVAVQLFDAHLGLADRREAEADVRQLLRQGLQQPAGGAEDVVARSEEHTSELQSLMRNSYAVFCLKQ